MRTMQIGCSRLMIVGAMLAPGLVAAQSVLGSRCDTLQAVNGQQAITLTQAVAANQWIVVSVAANSAFVEFAPNAVVDSAGNSYLIYDVTLMASYSGALATFAGRAVTPLNAGAQITVSYAVNGSATAQSCVQAAAFPGVLALTDPSDAYGERSGSGALQSVTTGAKTQFASDLIYSVFASASSPGLMVAGAPAQALTQMCSGDSTLCLLPAWNLGATAAGVNEAADAASQNSVPWGALLVSFQSNDRIFANDFE